VSLADPPRKIVDLRPIRNVARLELAVDLRGKALQPLPPPGDENAAPPPIGQAPREGAADTTRSTRDHRDRNARSVDCGAVTQDFHGKRGLVLGVANRRSIAWAIAQRLAAGGAKLAFTYQGERIEKGVRELADSVGSPLVTECDVCSDDEVARVLGEAGEVFGGELDLLVHSVAFADARDLEGRFTDTPRDRFWLALDDSAYSLVAAARAAEPLMEAAGGGSILTMTYLGGERVVPHYNVMGVAKAALDASVRYLAWELGEKQIRVNAVSAGPVRTLAARSIAGFPTMEAIVEERAPLRRPISAEDVGAAAAYLLSEDARNVTGTTLYVDSGYHAMGM
jgi:enoyl-[acyl-carrier protein] reductase I